MSHHRQLLNPPELHPAPGFSHVAIAEDYALSEIHLAPRLEQWLATAIDEEERERIRQISATPAPSMQRVLAELELRYGSVAAYLEAGGTSPEDVERARSRLRG